MDYCYFPDPDLLPLEISQDWIARTKSAMPEMPASVRDRLTREHQISDYDATLISSDRFSVAFFESVLAAKSGMPRALDDRLLRFPAAKVIANWMIGELGPLLDRHDRDYAHTPISAPAFAALLTRLQSDFLSAKGAKEILNSTFVRNLVIEDLREALNEIHLGILQGRFRDERDPEAQRLWEQRGEDKLAFRAPGGETYRELRHRVLGASGALTGYAGGIERKRTLLQLEGATFEPSTHVGPTQGTL